MEIKTLEMDKFGQFTGKGFDFPKGELLVFYGHNEAGKSTLFSAIHTLLTGFSPASRESFPYVPWGEEEASLRGEFYDGSKVLRRLRSRPEGQYIKHEEVLKIQNSPIINLNPNLYKSLYSITAEDLLDLERIRIEEVIEMRLSGTKEGFKSPADAMKTLDKKLLSLYSPRKNSTKEINVLEENLSLITKEVHLLEEKKRLDEEDEAFLNEVEEEILRLEEILQQEYQKNRPHRVHQMELSKSLGSNFYLKAKGLIEDIEALQEELQELSLQGSELHKLQRLDEGYFKLVELEKSMDLLLDKIKEERLTKKKKTTIRKSPFLFLGLLSFSFLILFFFLDSLLLRLLLVGLSLCLGALILVNARKEKVEPSFLERYEEDYGTLEEDYQHLLDSLQLESLLELDEERKDLRERLFAREKKKEGLKDALYQKEELLMEMKKTLKTYHEDLREALFMLKEDLEAIAEKKSLQGPSYKREKVDRLRNQLESLKERKHRALERHEQFLALKNLEDTLSQKKSLQKELEEKSWTYKRLQLLKGYLEKSYDRFLRDEEPKLLQRASRYLYDFTLGRYESVIKDEEGSFMLLKAEGYYESLKESHSKGTRNQLYLALRLSLAESVEEGESFPMIFDEAFSNWDHRRLLETLKVLSSLAKKRQMIIMTCSKEVLGLLENEIPCRIYRL